MKGEMLLTFHQKKMIAPIIVALILVLYYIAFFCVLMSMVDGIGMLLLGIVPLLLAAVVVKVCIERIQEIKKGEEDDLSQY